jgi:chromosome partitioning protein
MIVVIGGIKGGTGKTTLATNLAVIGSKLGKKVMLVDADEQGSTMDWAEQRDSMWHKDGIDPATHPTINFPTIALSGKFLHEQLKRFQNDFDDIYIDTGGRDTTSQRSALVIANCFLVPFKPRSFDVWTVGKVKDMIREVKILNSSLLVCVCINQGDSKGIDNEDAFKILSEVPEFKCLTTFMGHRKAFSNAAAQGLGVAELQKFDNKAYDEVYSVYDAIHTEYYGKYAGNSGGMHGC